MERKNALIGAAFLTLVIAAAVVMLFKSGGAQANDLPASSVAAQDPAIAAAPSSYEAEMAQRETALLEQVALREQALDDLDTAYAAQFAALEEQLASTNLSLKRTSRRIEILQTRAQAKADEIAAADLAFQAELSRLQNGLASQDAQMRAQLDGVIAQLQAAYDQLAAAQVAAAPPDNNGGNNNHTSPPPTRNDDEGEHEGEEEHEGDDEHEEHDDGHEHDDDGHEEHDDY